MACTVENLNFRMATYHAGIDMAGLSQAATISHTATFQTHTVMAALAAVLTCFIIDFGGFDTLFPGFQGS